MGRGQNDFFAVTMVSVEREYPTGEKSIREASGEYGGWIWDIYL